MVLVSQHSDRLVCRPQFTFVADDNVVDEILVAENLTGGRVRGYLTGHDLLDVGPRMVVSVASTTSNSVCPTPKVFTITQSLPEASRSLTAPLVALASSPWEPRMPIDRMNTPVAPDLTLLN